MKAFAQWLADQLPGTGDVRIEPLSQTAGNSHTIYAVDRGDRQWVLRVAPSHAEAKVGNAYNLQREWTVLKALAGTAIPHAAPVLHQDGSAPIDEDFLLLERVAGVTLEGQLPQHYSDSGRQLTDAIVDTLVAIGEVRCDLGEPDGPERSLRSDPTTQLARQFGKGRRMLAEFRTRDTPVLDAMIDELERYQPASSTIGLIHGDYSTLNIMAPLSGPPAVKAVLDWETATIGDVMIDIGYLTARWVRPEENAVLAAYTLGGAVPGRDYLAERYAEVSGRSMANLPYYQGFAMVRLAIALEGRVARLARRGNRDKAAMFAGIVDSAVDFGKGLMYA